MKNHLRYIFYIELIIEGDEIRRFINICRKDDITFIHMKYDGKYENRITVRMTRKDFFKLRKYIRLTHVHIKVTGKAYPVYFFVQIQKALFISDRHGCYVRCFTRAWDVCMGD